MCNDFRLKSGVHYLIETFRQTGLPLQFPQGLPNVEPREDVKITDRSPIVRIGPTGDPALEVLRWSWPSPQGKPVYNFRAEGRRFPAGRCLILADGFYEFTTPEDPKQKRKDKWLFTLKDHEVFAIAGVWRAAAAKGEDAFTMLTVEPGADIAPYHDRQVVVLSPPQWSAWLGHAPNEAELLMPAAAGSLEVQAVTPGAGSLI